MHANLWRDHGKPEEGTQGTVQLFVFSMLYWITVRRNGEFIFGNGLIINCLPSMRWLNDFAGSVVRKAWGAQYGLGQGNLDIIWETGVWFPADSPPEPTLHPGATSESTSTQAPPHTNDSPASPPKTPVVPQKVKSKMRFCHFIPIL